ncbi:MAG: hypothetical protein SFX73_28830 [Kofleriaceae bacterium]|nr:hypothetical protein [Kofleriaceae bacterium]
MKTFLSSILVAMCACGGPAAEPAGHVVTVLTVDWEGAYGASDGQAALVEMQRELDGAPLTHFISAAYFTREAPDPTVAPFLQEQARGGAENAMHLHAWNSLVRAAEVTPRSSPSFMTGTDKVFKLETGEDGFDIDLDAYDASELRRMLRLSRARLERQGLAISHSFRAGGYLVSANLRHALRAENYAVDSSAIDGREVNATGFFAQRLRTLWPALDVTAPPREVDGLVELPIAVVADYATEAHIGEVLDAAVARLQRNPDRDVFVTIALHQETCVEFAAVVSKALVAARARHGAATFLFTTVEKAAHLATSRPNP